ncbi:MAG: ATP-binding cassette domain-containing protein [Anaerolineae bacterium]
MMGNQAPGPEGVGPPPVIETRALAKRFGKTTAVHRLDLAVPAGSVVGLIGPNGAGKTTTLRMMAGLTPPTGGDILMDGRRVSWNGSRRIHGAIGYMPDFFGVYDEMRAWEYLDFFARCHDLPSGRRDHLVGELLDLVDLTAKRDADVNGLSRGMKQRLCLAQALVHDPRLLLLDEPASGLDPRARIEMRELLLELKALGKTIVVSSHILSELEHLCDQIVIMERGHLVAAGPVDLIDAQLQGAREVRMLVLSPRDEVVSWLDGHDGVQVVEDDPGETAAGWITFMLQGDDETQAALLAAMVSSGVRVASFAAREARLEDVFMRLTEGGVS